MFTRRALLQGSAALALAPGLRAQQQTFVVVKPGTHPGIVFCEQELAAMRRRAAGSSMAAEAWRRVKQVALAEPGALPGVKDAVGRAGRRLSKQLECMALVWQMERDESLGRRAVELFASVTAAIDPREFYNAVDSDFFATEHWPKALAFAWDWLYPCMRGGERRTILKRLEEWNAALYHHTESWWWREATYNCGAIPVGAQGVLLAAIQAETRYPEFDRWFSECFRKVKKNYFPLTWRADGICNEGSGYAHYHKNPTLFAEAVRRTGGEDIIGRSGAVNAMHYLRHQWMPQGRCGPVGDNTEYGRRVFQPIYLHGVRETGDRAGLWTWLKYTDFDRADPLETFLFYPDGVEPASPGELDLPVSHYFEVDRHRAGYVFARSEWDNERAHWFAFSTRYANANHTHYDMNSFLFTAFGEQFATHTNIYTYGHEHHGVDFEHNIVIVGEGGMPARDRSGSAGDDGSLFGLMTGVGLGHFADYVRGDARLSYADRSIPDATPAERANRCALFVKQGPVPYVVLADDIQKDAGEQDYHWQWYTEALSIGGEGTLERPFLIEGEEARCGIAFLEPAAPRHEFQVVQSPHRREVRLGLLRVSRRGVRLRFLAAGAAWRKDARQPAMRRGPVVEGHPLAASLWVEGDGFRDLVLWQPEAGERGRAVVAGPLKTDALMAVVRTDGAGRVTGYVMGDGSSLEFAGKVLARSPRRVSVSADARRTMANGPRRARRGLAPLAAAGTFWLPGPASELWADGKRIEAQAGADGMATV